MLCAIVDETTATRHVFVPVRLSLDKVRGIKREGSREREKGPGVREREKTAEQSRQSEV